MKLTVLMVWTIDI